jgi:hypothetical protein
MNKLRHSKLIIAACVSLPFFVALQLVTLGKWSVWYDEGFSAMLISYNTDSLLQRAALDVHPPLYYLVLKVWAAIFGSSVTTLRAFSVVCMTSVFVLSLWLVWRLAGRKATWLALPILMLAPSLIRYGQEMRMYAMAAMLGLTATHLLLTLIKQRFETKKRVSLWLVGLYAINVSLIIYTHYFASLLLVVHWLVLYIAMRGDGGTLRLKQFVGRLIRHERWWLAAYVGAATLFVPWLPSMARQVSQVNNGFWIGPASVSSFFSTIATFLIFRPEWSSWRLNGWYALTLLVATGVMGYFAYLIIKTKSLSSVAKTLLLGYWSVPMVLLFLVSLPPLTPYYYDRYFVTFAPLFYLFLAVGMFLAIKQHWHRRKQLTVFAVALIFGCLIFGSVQAQVHGNNFGHTKDDSFTMKPLSDYIREQWQPGDVVIAHGIWTYFDAHAYLNDLTTVKTHPDPNDNANDCLIRNRDDLIVRDLSSVQPGSHRVWLITERKISPSSLQQPNWTSLSSKTDGYAQIELFAVK